MFGIVSVSESGSGDYSYTFGSYSSLSATFSFPYRGDLLLGFIDGFDPYPYEGPSIYIYVNGYPVGYSGDNSVIDLGSNLGPNIDLTVFAFDEGGGSGFDIAIGGVVPETSPWAMMLLGFAGLGFVGCRRSREMRRAV